MKAEDGLPSECVRGQSRYQVMLRERQCAYDALFSFGRYC